MLDLIHFVQILLVISCVSLLGVTHGNGQNTRNQNLQEKSRREKISSPMCKKMPYQWTQFPNILRHQNQNDAGLEIHQFFPLVKVSCSPNLAPFLCSVYFPPVNEFGAVVPPCRSLCQSAKDGCENLMTNFGFPWPDKLRCDQFPTSGLCFNGSNYTPKPRKEKISSPMCKTMPYQWTQFPNVLRHQNQNDAGLEIHQFFPLVKVNCSPNLAPFLCSVYFPPVNEIGAVVPPCRSLCKSAKDGCENLMTNFGFPWPDKLRCDQFPTSGLCFNEESYPRSIPTSNTTGSLLSKHPTTKGSPLSEHPTTTTDTPTSTPTSDSNPRDADKPTECIQGNYNCRKSTSRAYIDDQTICCFDERQIYYQSMRGSLKPSCKCVYPTPEGVTATC